MDKKKTDQKTMMIVSIAAAAFVLLLVSVFIFVRESSTHDPILLPEPSAPAQSVEPDEPEAVFAQVTTENVQNLLSMLSRPTAYHQTLSVTRTSGELSREQSIEIWRSGALFLVQSTDAGGTRSCLSDGETLYLWYADDAIAETITLDGTIDLDDLIGVPSYESLLSLPKSSLRQADYVMLDEPATQCVFVEYRTDGVKNYCWVSLDSGLLCKQTALEDDSPIYTAEQTAYEAYMDTDEALKDIFVLPDGTQPFATEE